MLTLIVSERRLNFGDTLLQVSPASSYKVLLLYKSVPERRQVRLSTFPRETQD